MKTKRTNKLLVLIISVMMVATLFVGMSVTASAAEAEDTGAEFVGFQVNLGGDISMKYYVKNYESTVEQEMIRIKVTYLGTITEIRESAYIEDQDVYVFTFEGINPQCLGEKIDAELYISDVKVDEKLDYSVEDNLNGIYDASAAKTKQLIDDLRAYGKASEAYTGHTSMTGN
ncbi:MAG: hypothetical protein J6S76_05650, partial [Clostridia bacterium]|nr:hypothetical protein [Clostridia bacterium]